MHRYVRTHSDIGSVDKVMVLERIEFIMFHALEQPADGLITLDNHLQVQRMVNPCFGDSFGALPTRTSTHTNTHTHTHNHVLVQKMMLLFWDFVCHIEWNACSCECILVCIPRRRIYVWMLLITWKDTSLVPRKSASTPGTLSFSLASSWWQ